MTTASSPSSSPSAALKRIDSYRALRLVILVQRSVRMCSSVPLLLSMFTQLGLGAKSL
jgi:hypothetical protein